MMQIFKRRDIFRNTKLAKHPSFCVALWGCYVTFKSALMPSSLRITLHLEKRGRGREEGGRERHGEEEVGERREGGRGRGRREEGMRALPSEALAPSFIFCPVLPSSGTAEFHTDHCSAQRQQQWPGPRPCDSLPSVIELLNNEVCHQHRLT